MDWTEPKYPLSVSSFIAGQNHSTARSWFAKDLLYSKKDARAEGQGDMSLVTGLSVLAHAIAVKLAALNCPAEIACRAARSFTDIASPREAPGFERGPGQLFDGSFTYLAAYPSGPAFVVRGSGWKKRKKNKETKEVEEIVEVASVDDLLIGRRECDGCWIVPLDFIVKHVTVELQKIDDANKVVQAPKRHARDLVKA